MVGERERERERERETREREREREREKESGLRREGYGKKDMVIGRKII